MDLEFSPSILETPSLATPTITNDPVIFKSSYVTDEKSLTKIEHDLKQSVTQIRQPTESPFQKFAEAGALPVDKHLTIPSTTDDGIPIEIPSTAEVMNVIESFSKNLANDRDSETIPADSSIQMGVIVSPKKKLLYRSQSQTDVPIIIGQQEEVIVDDQQQFQRLNDIPLIDSMPIVGKGQAKRTLPQQEVTSTSKRSKAPPPPIQDTNPDDQRKQQIRDSNREAARRCRERRRQYIEQLEGNLEHHKIQIKQLQDKLGRLERENTQLRAILSESKILHTTRLSINDSQFDYGNASTIDMNSDSTDGPAIQRNYLTRNTL